MARLSKLSRSVEGKAAVVTGAASGMGRATAYLLADEGAKVAVVDLDPARVVNSASTEGLMATAGRPAYTASKHGVIGLTKSFAVELGRTGVTVNCICPGPIRTGMTANIPEDAKQTYAHRRVPLRRYGEP